MSNDREKEAKEEKKQGAGLELELEDMDLENGFVFNEEEENLGKIEEEAEEESFSFKINGVELEKKLTDPSKLTVNEMIPLFDGVSMELTSASIDFLPDKNNTTRKAKAKGGRLVVEPKRAGFVVEVPITEVLLRDDDTKLGDEASVEGVLKSAFAFPFKNGYMFIANEGLFNDIDLESIDGGTIHTGKSVIPADVMITSDGMAVGKKENLKSALQKAQQKEPKAEEPEEPETTKKSEEPEEPTPVEEPQKDEKPLIEGKELTTIKEVFSSEEQTEESEETEEAEVVDEDKTLVEQATDAAKDFLAEKRDALIEDLKGRAKKIAQESIAEARANLSFSKMVNQPKATVNQFKKDLWENFKSKAKEEAKTLYGEAKEAIEGIDDAVMDEISSAVWTKADELTDKMEWLNDVISNAAAFLNVAKELGIESEKIEKMQGTVNMMLDAMANFQEQSEEKLQQVFPQDEKGEEEEPEEEEDESKRISITFTVVPGFDVSLFLEPAYSLSFGGYMIVNLKLSHALI